VSRPNWSRPLLRPPKIPTVMTLSTLADVRTLIEKHLPAGHLQRDTWRHVSAQLHEAASDGSVDDVSMALRLVLSLERVPCVRVGHHRIRKRARR
jgi:hypothetical protein